jgi:hypothetical protein
MIPFRLCVLVLSGTLAFGVACGREKKEQKAFSVTSFFGDVKILSQGMESPATLDAALLPGDVIVTGKNSIADILYMNDGIVRVSPETNLTIDSLSKKDAGQVNLSNGAVFVTMSKLSKDRNFSVKTKTAVAAVRGTAFRVAEQNGVTDVAVVTGKMLVSPVVQGIAVEQAAVVVDGKSAVKLDEKIAEAASSGKAPLATREMPKEETAAMIQDVQTLAPLAAPVSSDPGLKEELTVALAPAPAADEALKAESEKKASEAKAAEEKVRQGRLAKEMKDKEDAVRAAAEAVEKERIIAEKKAKDEAAKKQKEKEDRVQNVPSI